MKPIKQSHHPLDLGLSLEERKLFNALFAGTGEWATLVINAEGIMEMVNPAAPVLLGIAKENLLGVSFFDFVPMLDLDGKPLPREERPAYKVLKEKYRQVQPFFCLYYHPKRKENITLASRAVGINGGDKLSGVVMYLREAQRQFDHKAVDRSFVSFAAHQLKTPAGTVQGFLEMMLREPIPGFEKGSRFHVYLTSAYEANLLFIRLAKDFLNSAKIRGGLIEPEVKTFNLPEVIEKKLSAYQQWLANKSVRLRTDYQMEGRATVSTDRAIITELFDIIFHNAVKYVPHSGIVEVVVSRDGPNFQILIRDNGPGLSAKDLDTNGEVMPGSGMGLRIARQYAILLKGKLVYEAVHPQGSSFTLHLPDFS
jgi:signal transduction histidine kinase